MFNSQAKALTIKTVYDELKRYLAAAGFSLADEALYRYTREIIRIYRYLIENGGDTGDEPDLLLAVSSGGREKKRKLSRFGRR